MNDVVFNAFKSAFIVYGIPGIVSISVLVGGFFIARYVIFKWLDAHFQHRLEAYKQQALAATEQQKHDLQAIIENKKLEINSRFDRTTRIHQLEFQMLPELWGKLNDCILKSQSLFGLRTYPDVVRLEDDKLIRHMKSLNFTENQVEIVLTSLDRAKSYQKIIDAIDYGEATSSFNEYAIAIRKSSIFVGPELFDKFKYYEDILKMALIEIDMNRQTFNQRHSFEHGAKLGEAAGQPLLDFQTEIRNRLWNTTSL